MNKLKLLIALTCVLVLTRTSDALGNHQPLALGPEISSDRDSSNYENWLKEQVRHQLVMLPWYSVFDNLTYRIEGSAVILEGQLYRPSLKPDAESVVKRIEGVETVVNNIEVLPPSPNDDRIRVATYRAIYWSTALQRYALQAVPPIHIVVKNGHITLEGTVATQGDKDVANVRARASRLSIG